LCTAASVGSTIPSCSCRMMGTTREGKGCDGECTTWSDWWLVFVIFWAKICTRRNTSIIRITIVPLHHHHTRRLARKTTKKTKKNEETEEVERRGREEKEERVEGEGRKEERNSNKKADWKLMGRKKMSSWYP